MLPTYAFQRERYWLDAPKRNAAAAAEHPLLETAVTLADAEGCLLTGRLSRASHGWMCGHRVFDEVLVPATALVELALTAGQRVGLERLEELTLEAPMGLPANGAIELQVSVAGKDVSIFSRPPDGEWTRHATGVLAAATAPGAFELRTWPPVGATEVAIDGLYERLAERGVTYGEEFRGLRAVWRRDDELFAEVELPQSVAGEAPHYGLHPALLDAALHALLVEPDDDEIRMPFAWTGVTLSATGAARSACGCAATTRRSSCGSPTRRASRWANRSAARACSDASAATARAVRGTRRAVRGAVGAGGDGRERAAGRGA